MEYLFCKYFLYKTATIFTTLSAEQKESALRCYFLQVAAEPKVERLKCLFQIILQLVNTNSITAR